MAKLVTKFKYLNKDSPNSVGGYAKYIATREGVEKIDDTYKMAPATQKQHKLIRKILKDFPDSKEMLEYADFLKQLTVGAASEFITRAVEDNADQIADSKTYADYIATRPGAERYGAHGLFTKSGEQVELSKVSEELNQHDGNVWTLIISLRREDAQRLGFDNGARWREMLRNQDEAIASALGVPLINLKWYISMTKDGWKKHSYAAACSVTDKVLFQMMKDNPNIKNVFVCFDNDEAGQTAATQLCAKLAAMNISASTLLPLNKDWNEDLVKSFEEQEEQAGMQQMM